MKILGNTKEIEIFRRSVLGSRPANSWILSGPMGIGKASIAKMVAKELLCTEETLHPDLMIIEKTIEEKKNIPIEKIREIKNFVSLTPRLSKHKVIIIDDIDSMSINAANALLKALEEPKKHHFLFLITHNLSRILPTIKSRCHIIKFKNLNKEECKQILNNKGFTDTELVEFYTCLANNNPKLALDFASADIYKAINLIQDLQNDKYNMNKISELMKFNHKMIFDFIIRIIHLATQLKLGIISSLNGIEGEIIKNLQQNNSLFDLFRKREEIMNLILGYEKSNLDLKTQLLLITEKL